MPIFEYGCEVCQTQFEELVRSPDQAREIRCPKCDAGQVHRLLSVFGFRSGGASADRGSGSSGSSCASCTAPSCAGCH